MNDIYNYFYRYPRNVIDLFLKMYYKNEVFKIINYFINSKINKEIPNDILITLNKMEQELKQANKFLKYRDFNELEKYWKLLFYEKKLIEGDYMENIYTYFRYDKEIIDATFMGMKNHELKENFVKRWGRELEGNSNYNYTEKDKKDFPKYKKLFMKGLEYAKSRYENGYSLEEITKSLRENKKLKLRLPVYENKKELCNALNISYKQLDSILEQIDLNEKLAFTYYVGLDRPKMHLGEISKLLNCEVEQIIDFLIKTNSFIRKEANIIEKENETKKRGRKSVKNFYDFFEESDKYNVQNILNSYKKINHTSYQLIVKIYGPNYNNYNYDIELTKQELNCLNNFKTKIKAYLKQIKSGISLEDICDSIEKNKSKKNAKKSFFDSFKEIDRENVKSILNIYKEINHKYYKLIVKIYGPDYDNYNYDIELTKQELNCLNNFRVKIKAYLKQINNGITLDEVCCSIKPNSNKTKEVILKPNRTKKSFLDSFKEADRENVKIILKAYKEVNHKYYQNLNKIYNEDYIMRDFNSELTTEEKYCLNNLKSQIKIYLAKIKNGRDINEIYSKITKKKLSPKMDTTEKMMGEEIIILKAIFEQEMTIEEISNNFGILEKKIDFCLIKYLHLFKENIATILLDVLKRNNYSTGEIINFSYLKKEMQNLTELEKMYLYLKLDSYHNSFLDDEKIAKILGLSIQDMNNYQIMTKSDNLNELNKIFVKK